jgi:protein-L-isoaspartate(D-aspartate) O-methyltransferase
MLRRWLGWPRAYRFEPEVSHATCVLNTKGWRGMDPFLEQRRQMVEATIEARGVRDARVLEAMRQVPRHLFVPEDLRASAYLDGPLPIGEGQTISQPYIVAIMTAALGLRPEDRVLEIGTGSGYGAAVLGRLASNVETLERHETLAAQAKERLRAAGFENVRVHHADGTLGWPAQAPYNGISVTAGGTRIPEALLWQLAQGGRLVMPVGSAEAQSLMRVTRTPDGHFDREDLGPVRFVPLVGST